MSSLSLPSACLAPATEPLVTIAPAARRTAGTLLRTDFTGTPALICAWLVAVTLPLGMGSASAATFTVSANSTTAQTLGTGSGQTGAIAFGKTLAVNGVTVAVTISVKGCPMPAAATGLN